MLAAYKRDNLQMEVMFPITWGGRWDYPYPEAQELIRGMRDLFGAGKLVWGSDMPNVERFCTYRQSLDYVRRYCPFLSASREGRRCSAGTPPNCIGLGLRARGLMGVRIGIDIGGTFTDLVFLDDEGRRLRRERCSRRPRTTAGAS